MPECAPVSQTVPRTAGPVAIASGGAFHRPASIAASAMNFLAPWFLLGGLAIVGPVLFHLIRRSARERMPFSSLLFLRSTPPRATRRRKLEHLILLALRCLALLLLATGFARPFIVNHTPPPPADVQHQTVILLDTSASMRRQGLWAKARGVAARYLQKARPGDHLEVLVFDLQPRTLVSFAEWSAWSPDQRAALAQQRLDLQSPGWNGTQLGLALTTAAEQFSDETLASPGPREIVLASDMQEGAKLEGLQGHDWPKNVRVTLEQVDPARRGNAGLELVEGGPDVSDNGRVPRARVVNTRDSTAETFRLGWVETNGVGFKGEPQEIYLPPGMARTVAAPALPAGASTGALRLVGDDEEFDNTAWFAPPDPQRVTVAYFGSEPATDPGKLRYYLQRAFPPSARRQIDVETVTHSGLATNILDRAALAIIPTRIDASEIAAVRAWLAGGKTALMVLTNTDSGPTLAALLGLNEHEIAVSAAAGDYALLGTVDFSHPLFAPFADPRYSDFSRIHFWKRRRVAFPATLPVRVLAKFDDGSPALAQIPVGQGSLLVLASGWQPDDSQLALSTKFVPLLLNLLDWSGGGAPERGQFQTGDALPSPAAAGGGVRWEKPDGTTVTLDAGKPFTATDAPGVYTATANGRLRRFAVNLPLDESRTSPMSPDDLARLGVPLQSVDDVLKATSPAVQQRLLGAELENRQKLWRWLIVALLACALVEMALSGRLARRVKSLEVAP